MPGIGEHGRNPGIERFDDRLHPPPFPGQVNQAVCHAEKSAQLLGRVFVNKIGTQRQTTVAVESAINNLLTAREMMLAQARTMAQAYKAYHISDTRIRAVAGTILELNSAQLNRTQAHLNYSQAIYDYLSAQADYDRIVGREVGGN